MAFDVPRLGGYQIVNPPESVESFWEPIQTINELADGSMRQRIIGFRFRSILTWDTNWIRSQDLTGLIAIANDTTASLTYLPRPTTKPSLTFSVLWENKFDFKFHQGRYDVYAGSISLVSNSTTATVGDLP